jgi:hypothetical protein
MKGYRDCWFYYNEPDKPYCLLGLKCCHMWKQKNVKCGDICVCGYKDCVRLNDGRRGSYRVLVRKPERKRQFARPRHRWNVHIQMVLQKIVWRVWHGLNWSDSGYGQVADSCQCGNEPSNFHKIPGISSLAKELGALHLVSSHCVRNWRYILQIILSLKRTHRHTEPITAT